MRQVRQAKCAQLSIPTPDMIYHLLLIIIEISSNYIPTGLIAKKDKRTFVILMNKIDDWLAARVFLHGLATQGILDLYPKLQVLDSPMALLTALTSSHAQYKQAFEASFV